VAALVPGAIDPVRARREHPGMAFEMRDGWAEEPLSITGAEYVEPSATELLKPGQRVAHLFARNVMTEYVLQRVCDRVWWVSRQFYNALFYVGTKGVLLLDVPLGSAAAILAAVREVTSLPVTAVCYSHFHADHVGGARKLEQLLGYPLRVIASEHTAAWMESFGTDLPLPTDVVRWPDGVAEFEGAELELRGLPRPGHSPDHCVWLLPQQRVGHSADLINPDQLPFGGLAGQEPAVLFRANLRFARDLDFEWFSGGHGNVGDKSDFDFYLSYLDEVAELVREECPRPDYTPDLSQTSYLDDLGDDAKDQLLRELDNHFGFYLRGREIAGVQAPGAASGNPFLAGPVGEWAAARQKAVDEAVPRIMARLRPKYGRMYSFEDAQAINVRLMAQAIQPTLPNR
jgi:glyoxylase-like metal-dependent hydrolase (beta-lactamase superfamily II)